MSEALFRPGELESPSLHAVARDLRGLKGVLRLNRDAVEAIRKAFELTRPASKLLALMLALPRSDSAPGTVGLQASAEAKADFLNCSVTTLHNARRELRRRGLLVTYQQQRTVKAITRARKPEHRLRSFTSHSASGRASEHAKADCYAVDYPSRRALALARDWKPEEKQPEPLWKTLWSWLQERCRRFAILAKRQRQNCTPNNEGECEGDAVALGSVPAASDGASAGGKSRATGGAGRTSDEPRADFQHSRDKIACGKPPSRTRYADGRSRKSQPLPASGSYGGWSLPPPAELRKQIKFHESRLRSSLLIPGEFDRHKEAIGELRRELWRRKAVTRRMRKAK